MFRVSRLLGVTGAVVSLVSCAPDGGDPTDPGGPAGGNALRWSDPATWPSGRVPAAGDSVVIPANLAVRLDTTPPPLQSLTVEGTLVLGDRDLALTTGWVLVRGTFQAGTENSPYTHRAIITLTGTTGNPDVSGMGNKVLGVSGRLELHGQRRAGWTRLDGTATAGATSIQLLTNPGWRVGDRLVLASSDYSPDRYDEVVVAGVSGRTLTLAAPLRYEHFGQVVTVHGTPVDERAEVGLLTRNITIQGDTGGVPGYGGHIIVLAGAIAHVEGVELFQMGQRGKLARYPMHWHMAGDVTGQYFRNSSVWRTFNRCVTVHGTDNAVVRDNVCYDHTGHGYFLEDGAETGNLIQGNLGLVSRVPQGSDQLLGSDATPATFWITNPDNTVRQNVAAGSRGFGFWYALPQSPTGLSVGAPDLPRTTPLREFSANVAHSDQNAGLNVDNGPRLDGTTEVTNYAPRLDPAATSDPVVADFTGLLAYKHAGRAVWLRGSHLRLSHSVLADNAVGATFAASETAVQNTVFIGQTGATTRLPSPTVLRGYEFYDGRVWADQVTFVNYAAATTVPASALGYNRNNAFPIDPLNYAGRMTFVNANEVYLEDPHADRDGDKAAVFVDQSGVLTGTDNQRVVANTPILVTPACGYRAAWNAWTCPLRYDRLWLNSATGEAVAPLTVARDDGATLPLTGTGGASASAALSVIPGRSYSIAWSGSVPASPRFYLQSGAPGDTVSLTLPYPAAPAGVVRDYYAGNPMSAAPDLASFSASTGDRYFFDAAQGRLHLKLVVMAGRDYAALFVQP
jgi:cell surface hyaluronidase